MYIVFSLVENLFVTDKHKHKRNYSNVFANQCNMKPLNTTASNQLNISQNPNKLKQNNRKHGHQHSHQRSHHNITNQHIKNLNPSPFKHNHKPKHKHINSIMFFSNVNKINNAVNDKKTSTKESTNSIKSAEHNINVYNGIDTPEELHFLYVSILQNGKHLAEHF